jgi:hypothetical protein
MPKQMLTLNDFSGGLNTKASARDIAPNELQQSLDCIISIPGVVKTSKSITDKDADSDNSLVKTAKGNGLFYFNLQNDIGRTSGSAADYESPVQVLAYPSGTDIQFYTRAFANTGDWTHQGSDNEIAVGGTTTIEPVYYFVDGRLYVSDKRVVDGDNSTSPKVIEFVDKPRFGKTDIAEFVSGDTIVGPTDADTFKTIGNTGTQTTPADAGDFDLAFDSTPTQQNLSNIQHSSVNIQVTTTVVESIDDVMTVTKASSSADISGVSALAVGEVVYLNSEAVRITSLSGTTTLTLGIERGVAGTTIGEHAVDTVLQSSSDDPIGGGDWEEGTYEFTHTLVNYSEDETLPHAAESTTALVAAGDYFSDIAVRINIEATFRKREKGFRIYTRIKDNNDRWRLFVDADYERGVRTNLFEDYTSWTNGSGNVYGDGDTNGYAEVTGLTSKSPSLDTYESITGYTQEEQSISFGSDGGYKSSTICARRAWVANVRKDNIVYDDRIYYSPVNRFSTFPDSFYLDIGISDGDSFAALHSVGNKLLAFKQKKLYVVNVSSSSDSGWYLESEYDGMGCLYQEAVTKTPFGVCWVNEDGVYIYTGETSPIELSLKLDDEDWRSATEGKVPAIGYDGKHKRLLVVQDTGGAGGSAQNNVWSYDFSTQSWSQTKREFLLTNDGVPGISNFIESFDGIYLNEYHTTSSSNVKYINKLEVGETEGTGGLTIQTKDIDFGSPGRVKKVYKVYVTARTLGSSTTLAVTRASDGSTTYGNSADLSFSSANYAVQAYTADADCESMSFKLTASTGALEISDIVIEYREKYKRAS